MIPFIVVGAVALAALSFCLGIVVGSREKKELGEWVYPYDKLQRGQTYKLYSVTGEEYFLMRWGHDGCRVRRTSETGMFFSWSQFVELFPEHADLRPYRKPVVEPGNVSAILSLDELAFIEARRSAEKEIDEVSLAVTKLSP